jgi:hypothetical protein
VTDPFLAALDDVLAAKRAQNSALYTDQERVHALGAFIAKAAGGDSAALQKLEEYREKSPEPAGQLDALIEAARARSQAGNDPAWRSWRSSDDVATAMASRPSELTQTQIHAVGDAETTPSVVSAQFCAPPTQEADPSQASAVEPIPSIAGLVPATPPDLSIRFSGVPGGTPDRSPQSSPSTPADLKPLPPEQGLDEVPLPTRGLNRLAVELYGERRAAHLKRAALRPGETERDFKDRCQRGREAAAVAERWAKQARAASDPDPSARGSSWMSR